MPRKKQVKPISRTEGSKEYRQLLQEVDRTVDKYSDIVSRAVGQTKEEIEGEIQVIYLDNLRKADDPVAMQKENLVNLMLKKQTSDYMKEHMAKKALEKAEKEGNEEKIKEIEGQMIDDLMISEFDLKVNKAIQDAIKAYQTSEKRSNNAVVQSQDDNHSFPNIIDGELKN